MDAGQTSPTPTTRAANQNTVVPWLRKMVVTIGPLEENKNATSGPVYQFTSDGTMKGIKTVCKISKTVMGFPKPSTISIYNLSRETRNGIHRGMTKITIEAGWDNTELHKVFQGSVMSAVTERSGADLITKLNCLPGFASLLLGYGSVSYGPNFDVKQAVKDLGGKADGLTVDDSNLKEINGKFGKKGWSFAGAIKDALTELAGEFGFSWSVENNSLVAVGDKAKFDGITILDGQEGGLMQITPVLKGPMQIQTGVKIKAIYVPNVRPGATVKVNSVINENLNGDYRVHTVDYDLDPYSETWTMDIESFKFWF